MSTDGLKVTKFATREAWMTALVEKLTPRLAEASGRPVPKVRVSVGRTSKKKYIGECWHAEASADQTREIFIRPDQDDPVEVAGILAHELVHAFLPPDAKHGISFKRLGKAIGLEGKPTEMHPGTALTGELTVICNTLGPFPHAKLAMIKPGKKQTTRLIKALCEETGYTTRITRQWLDMFGAPLCACCKDEMQIVEAGGES